MVKVARVLQLSNGIILSKTASTGELLVRVNKKNIFFTETFPEENEDDGNFWITIMPDKECYWDWFSGNVNGMSQTANNAFYRRGYGGVERLAPCIRDLIKKPTTILLEEFIPTIEQLDEAKIVGELEKIAVRYSR